MKLRYFVVGLLILILIGVGVLVGINTMKSEKDERVLQKINDSNLSLEEKQVIESAFGEENIALNNGYGVQSCSSESDCSLILCPDRGALLGSGGQAQCINSVCKCIYE